MFFDLFPWSDYTIHHLMIFLYQITKGKENFMKKWYIYLVVSVLIAFELAVSDIISLSIMLLVGKINFFKWNNNAADLISVSADPQ